MQTNFFFHSPVKVYVEVDPYNVISDFLADRVRVGVVSGPNAIVKTGFKDFLLKRFVDKEIFFFDEVEENPSINTVIKGGKFLREHHCEAVIAFGGGSAIDASKACALFAENNVSFYELLTTVRYNLPLPILAIPTTCGTGSEVNHYSIVTDIEKKDKVNLNKKDSFPKEALLWSDFLKSLNEETMLATSFDAFTHAFEGYISLSSNPFTDIIAIESMKIIMKNIKNFIDGKKPDLKELLYASSLAGIVILHTGTTLLHALGYYLTNVHNVHHGKANALLLPSFMEMCRKKGVFKMEMVDNILKEIDIDITYAVDTLFPLKIDKVICSGEIEGWVEYSISKPNSSKTPFTVEKDYILSNLV